MKEKLVLIMLLMSVMAGYGQENWKKERIKLPPTVCYASPESYHSFVHPPAEYLQKLKAGSLRSAAINVTYIGFPQKAQEAFQYAVDIWQTLIDSPVPIHLTATWEILASNVLGSCGPSDYFKNFNSTEIWNCYYPVSIIEKMLGEEVNGANQPDMEASFNKDFANWYLETDGNTPSDKYDFTSVVLHELTHGLGFVGEFYSSGGRGGYGNGDGYGAVFDQFVENKSGNKLVNTTLFVNPSIKLNQNLTSNWLAFDTHLVQASLPRLYAPNVWDSGSSIYHLDETTYPHGDPNSLMTPFEGMGEAIHDPGPLALSILYQMGWKTVAIKHTPIKDIEYVSSPISFDAKITSDYALDSTKLYLVYSSNAFAKADSVLLKATNIPTLFSAELNRTKDGETDYFFSATDAKKNRYVYPSGSPGRYLSFKIGIDNEPPVIVYSPIKYLMATNLNTKISAQVTDNIGVQSVKLEYFVNGGIIKEMELKNDSADTYSGDLSFPAGSLVDNDLVSYRIVTVDSSSQSNIGSLPLTGYFNFRIVGFHSPVDIYTNNFDKDSLDFISNDFRIYTVPGFDNPALNSPHPYPSPDTDNGEINLTTVLKYPIILKTGGKMSYDEIVLVEPGEPGIKFGDPNFYDYVIVEGSSDEGKTWKPLVDGYDSNFHTSWATLFNSDITGQNSNAVPTTSMFFNHEIDLLSNGNFEAGDTIQVRFRLFSDPYAHGWGWMIDNLKIQDFGTAINPVLLTSGEVNYYPNPATDRLNLEVQSQNIIHKILLKGYSSSGTMVYTQSYPMVAGTLHEEIDVSNFTAGLYLFVLEPENGQAVSRKILIK